MEIHSTRQRDVHAVFWLGLPLASLAIKFLVPLAGERRWEAFMTSELGFVENATALLLLPAVVVSLLLFRRRRQFPRGYGWLLLLLAVAALFFAGEEISWGQHYFGWETPQTIAEVNRQQEFNIHNTYSKYGGNLLNNIPRQLLNVGMILIVVLPLASAVMQHRQARGNRGNGWLWRLHDKARDRKSIWYWLLPNYRLIPTALLALLLRVPSKLPSLFPQTPRDGYLSLALLRAAGEFKEYAFAMAILIYVLSVYARLPTKQSMPSAP